MGGRERENEIREDAAWREKRQQKEGEPAEFKSCPVVVAMPRAKQGFISFWSSDLFWCSEFLPHKLVHDSACEECIEHLLDNRPTHSGRLTTKPMTSM